MALLSTVSAETPARPLPNHLCLFDGLAPFFLHHREGTVNWSKIPFADLESDGVLDPAWIADILAEFDRHVAGMAKLGYNAVAIDDLAHLITLPFYPDTLKRKLASYRPLYAHIFETAKTHGLRIFAITDYLFVNEVIERHIRGDGTGARDFLRTTVSAAFRAWPKLDGLVLRIGESDGVDVHGDFTSRLSVRTPREARELLQALLPIFEAQGKTLIFRTWTLGAYPVGDLIWNQRTYDAVFGGIQSPNLVVSMKYGDADFFRFLELNPLFFHGPQRKIVELQCRREYEGMGEYPSFVGYLYATYLARLRAGGSNLVGIYALQGGGWAPFRRTAFCTNASQWNELNAEVTVRLFNGNGTLEEIVADFCLRHAISDVEGFLRLLTLADSAIEKGLYIREIARQVVYFRRVRLPPLMWVFWNHVTTDGIVATLTRYLVRNREAAAREGHQAVQTVEEMLRLARRLGLPDEDIHFQLDTFRLLAYAREVLLGLDSQETHQRLRTLLADYQRTYPDGYRFHTAAADVNDVNGEDRWLHIIVPLLLRRHSQYRRRDRILLSCGVTRLKRYVANRQRAALPRFVDTQGMASDMLLR